MTSMRGLSICAQHAAPVSAHRTRVYLSTTRPLVPILLSPCTAGPRGDGWGCGVHTRRARGGTVAPAAAAAAVATAASASTAAAGPFFMQGWPLWASVFGCAALGHLAEKHTKIGELLSAPLVSMLVALALSATGVIPPDCTSYDVVWKYMMPMAASCFMLNTDVARLAQTGGATLAAFLVGSVGMVAGAVIGWWLLQDHLGSEGCKLAAALCSSYVGGSVNFCAIATAVDLSPSVIPAAMCADNIGMAAYLAVLLAVPTGARLAGAAAAAAGTSPKAAVVPPHKAIPASSAESSTPPASSGQCFDKEPLLASSVPRQQVAASSAPSEPSVTSGSLILCVATASVANALAQVLAGFWNIPHLTLLVMSVLTIMLGSTWKAVLNAVEKEDEQGASKDFFAGGTQLGGALMLIFFAIIGASAGSLSGLSLTAPLMAFMTIMVIVHWVILAAGAHLLKLPRDATLLGSNACIGGPATATAMAQSRGWSHMVSPAMLSGSLGYGIGTAAGLLVLRLTSSLM